MKAFFFSLEDNLSNIGTNHYTFEAQCNLERC